MELEKFPKSATPRRPGTSSLLGGAFGLANCDHLFGVRAGQFTTAREAAAFANAGKILSNWISGFTHSENFEDRFRRNHTS